MKRRRIGFGIRWGLFVAFGVICALGVVAAIAAGYALQRLNNAIETIVDHRLPTAVTALDLARKAEALVAAARLLASPVNEATTDRQWTEIQERLKAVSIHLDQSLGSHEPALEQALRQAVVALANNLADINSITHERLKNADREADALHRRLTNLQSFQQELQPRLRVLDAQASQIAGGDPARLHDDPLLIGRISDVAKLVPAARASIDVQTINNLLLLISTVDSEADLAISAAAINRLLGRLDNSIPLIDQDLGAKLRDKLTSLHDIVDGPNGIIPLHRFGLELTARSTQLLRDNEAITHTFSTTLQALVQQSQQAISSASDNAMSIERNGIALLIVVVAVSIAAALLIMVFYVDRHILARLGQIRDGMLAVAAGDYNIPPPRLGPDELGRLGAALVKFRTTAIEAERMALLDPLTGVANRRHLSDRASAMIAIARRGSRPLSAAIFDIDHFKQINDSWGHAVGDIVLQRVAAIVTEELRISDFLARVGGEEFVLLLPDTSLTDAERVAERIRMTIASTRIGSDDSVISVTISFGVASLLPEEEKLEHLLARADKALYEAKRGGRNRVVPAVA